MKVKEYRRRRDAEFVIEAIIFAVLFTMILFASFHGEKICLQCSLLWEYA